MLGLGTKSSVQALGVSNPCCRHYFIQNTVHTNTYNNLYMTKQIQYNERDAEESH